MTDIPNDLSDSAEPAPSSKSTPIAAPNATFEGERIAKAIARAGIASRRDAEALIEAGRVSLNGTVLDSPAINVTDSDKITVDGEPLPARERTRLWILHKPCGVVTTARDPEGRQTVFDILPDDLPRVVAIGRLDINTEGLLLLTNDGGLAKVIAHPETGWLRRYRVRAFGEISQSELDKLRKGVTVDGMEYGPVEASLDRAQGDNVWITLGLREGKNREVKRILEHLGLSVNRLIRLSFGPFQLGEMEVGLVEEVRTKVLKDQLGKTLSEQAGVDFESPVREPIAPFGKPKKPAPAQSGASRAPGSAAQRTAKGPPRPSAGPQGARAGRPGRDPARPPTPQRVPTGGMGPGPRQSIWRADEESGERRPHGTKIPRRGSDPKAARNEAPKRERERVGAIQSGDRRVLVERLQPTPEMPAPEPHRRVRIRPRDEAGEATQHGRRSERRPPPQHAARDDGHRSERSDNPPREERAPRGERPRGFGKGAPGGNRSNRGPDDRKPGDRVPGGRPGGFKGGKPGADHKARGFDDRKPGDRPSGGRPGGKPGGERNARRFDDRKPGDRPSGGRAGGFGGGKPGGGAKPGPRGQRPPPRGGR